MQYRGGGMHARVEFGIDAIAESQEQHGFAEWLEGECALAIGHLHHARLDFSASRSSAMRALRAAGS